MPNITAQKSCVLSHAFAMPSGTPMHQRVQTRPERVQTVAPVDPGPSPFPPLVDYRSPLQGALHPEPAQSAGAIASVPAGTPAESWPFPTSRTPSASEEYNQQPKPFRSSSARLQLTNPTVHAPRAIALYQETITTDSTLPLSVHGAAPDDRT